MKNLIGLKGVILGASLLLSGCDQISELPFGNGYVAKNVCSGIFVSGIEEHTLINNYIAPGVAPLPLLWNIDIDRDNQRVIASDIIFNNIFAHEAHYRPGLGCTLLQDSTPEDLDNQPSAGLQTSALSSNEYWPHGNAGINPLPRNDINYPAIESAIDEAFLEPDEGMKQTVAVVVAYDDELITERYARSIDEDTRLTGWSMSKSFTSTLIGLMQDRNLIDVYEQAPIPSWKDTEKENITLENLLHMASGLEYYEQSRGPNRDQSHMLHATSNFSEFVIAQPLIAEPGSRYNYSTGDTNLLARISQDRLGGTIASTQSFIKASLFEPLGISDAILEYDTSGNPVGGAYLMMKPRDWARLGLLYARDGDWFGSRVLSSDWIGYATTASPANKEYGAQIWLNTDQETWPNLPEDTIAFLGYLQQSVYIIPSQKLVVVRMGFTFDADSESEKLVAKILESLPQ